MVRYLSFSFARVRFLSWTSAIFSFSPSDAQSMLMASSMRSKYRAMYSRARRVSGSGQPRLVHEVEKGEAEELGQAEEQGQRDAARTVASRRTDGELRVGICKVVVIGGHRQRVRVLLDRPDELVAQPDDGFPPGADQRGRVLRIVVRPCVVDDSIDQPVFVVEQQFAQGMLHCVTGTVDLPRWTDCGQGAEQPAGVTARGGPPGVPGSSTSRTCSVAGPGDGPVRCARLQCTRMFPALLVNPRVSDLLAPLR